MGVQASQPSQRIALIDGNSFYCSCERVLRPALQGRPLIVLSNNDGCAIARTQEAKDLGVKMGAPWFKIRHLEQSHGLVALSANFSLYGDLSDRMMSVIGQFSPRQEIYSIDESFLDLTGVPGTGREVGTEIRNRVLKWVGIPTCVGIGPSKTLAKMANHLAKKTPRLAGVCDLKNIDQDRRLRILSHVPVNEVWGIGGRLTPKLHALDIHTAGDLASASPTVLRDKFSIVLAKTARELAGESCFDWEDSPPPKKEIMVSRSFGWPVLAMADLNQALSTFVARAAEKLRRQSLHALSVLVFIRTSYFRPDPEYSGGVIIKLGQPTDDTTRLLAAVAQGLRKIFKPGFKYAKAGVCLLDLAPAQETGSQGEMFCTSAPVPDRSGLMEIIDGLNQRFGRSTVAAASTLSRPDAAWKMRQQRMTPAYTTDWDQLVDVWR